MIPSPHFRAGTVALVGRPNVGKSSLLNAIVGQKVSIVSDKPQTTRRRVIGVAHGPDWQIAFIDTPGVHEPFSRLGRAMVEQARAALGDVDLVVPVVDVSQAPTDADRMIGSLVKESGFPTLVCLNKMDLLKAEFVERNTHDYQEMFGATESMLTIATTGENLPLLVQQIVAHFPERPPMFRPEEYTDQSQRFLSAELVREKILLATRQEVPHAVAVRIDEWLEEPKRVTIRATIVAEKASQRAILIGRGGQFIKAIGTAARVEIEKVIGHPVYLELFVKVEEGWRQNPRLIHELNYDG